MGLGNLKQKLITPLHLVESFDFDIFRHLGEFVGACRKYSDELNLYYVKLITFLIGGLRFELGHGALVREHFIPNVGLPDVDSDLVGSQCGFRTLGWQPKTKGTFATILLVVSIGLLAWGYQATQPPPPKTCGSPDGPSVTAPRIKLSDGRHLAYKESGVPRENAKYKIVYIHGYDGSRHDNLINFLSQDVIESLGVYFVSFDRPGYGESDPNPKRTVKSLAFDIQELADQLGLGSKFYVMGFSMGGQAVWTCLRYIPHRLAGAALIAPVVNYWWPRLPVNMSQEAFNLRLPQDKWTLRIAHYLPWLTYWWNTQKFFPACSAAGRNPAVFSSKDLELISKARSGQDYRAQVRQQGEYESLHRDLMISFGTWEFDPMDLENPFPSNEGSVHLWQGDEDRLSSVTLQRYIAQQLPWIQYHEIPGAGHLVPMVDGIADKIIKALLTA